MSDLGGKLVTAITDSLEYLSCAAGCKFASQAADQNIDRAVQNVFIAPPASDRAIGLVTTRSLDE